MAVLLPLALAAAAATAGPGVYLLSITGVRLGPQEYVSAFSLELSGVEPLAVCRFPPDWTVTAGADGGAQAVISGQAGHGVAFLDRARLRELRGLALVRLDAPVRPRPTPVSGGERPPTFAGHADVGVYGPTEHARQLPLTAANVRLTRATCCPPR